MGSRFSFSVLYSGSHREEELARALGFDIGGSSIKAAVVDTATGQLVTEQRSIVVPSPLKYDDLKATIKLHITKLDWNGPVGIGYPGVLINGEARTAAHVDESFIGFNLETAFTKELGDVAIINDADAAGLAEMKFGAGREQNQAGGGTVVMITLGTGIGTALFTEGCLFPNTEFGHMMIGDQEAEEIAAASIKTRDKLDYEQWTGQLNLFLRELYRLLTPDLIVIGGAISESFDHFEKYIDVDCPVKPAELGHSAGVVGAALNAVASHKK